MSRETSEAFQIFGDIGAPIFAQWIARHARKLGLRGAILRHAVGRIDLAVSGQPEMLDAFALACSLGPQEVWVDRIDRQPNAAQPRNDFSARAE